MLSVDVHLDPLGDVSHRQTLVRVAIWNTGEGTLLSGDYRFAVSHQFDSTYGQRAASITGISEPTAHELIEHRAWQWKTGSVVGFKRQRGAAVLLSKVLQKAGI